MNIDYFTFFISTNGVIALSIAGCALFLKTYLSRKAEHLATKEDLAALTRPVEEIKLEFRLQEERARATFGIQLAAHRVLFEHEFQVYRDLWERILVVRDKLNKYVSLAFVAARTGPADRVAGYGEVSDAAKELIAFSERHRPFFAPEVHKALFMLSVTLRQIAAESSILDSISDDEIQSRIKKNVDETAVSQRVLEKAIRNRLYPDLWGEVSETD